MDDCSSIRNQLNAKPPVRLSGGVTLQRQCACGQHTSAGGECEECKKEHEGTLHRAAINPLPVHNVPPIVHEVLGSPGQSLDASTRAFMEPRFGRYFGSVRVHTDAKAAESARAVNALAYTVGGDVVFDTAHYSPETDAGRRLIAHELVHTLQQTGSVSRASATVSDPAGPAEREADRLEDQVMAGWTIRPDSKVSASQEVLFRIPVRNPVQPPTGLRSSGTSTATAASASDPTPPRGTNPGDCMEAVCRLAISSVPTSDADATQRVNDWERASIACIRADGPASNAAHQAAIVSNEADEISVDAAALRVTLASLGRSPRRYVDFRNSINETCARKAREVRIEFNYNVIFENPPGAARWGYGAGDWDSIDAALSALPLEATWTNPRLIRFVRASCHPDDLSLSGVCVGRSGRSGRGFTGGEADASTGRITVFERGLGNAPYQRSVGLGLLATQQTLRHEVGHIVMSQIPRAEQAQFFTQTLPWRDFSWAWITSPSPRYPNWQAERNSLRAELGIDEGQLDTWLAGLSTNTPVTVGARTYTRDTRGSGGTTLFLSSVAWEQLPAGVVFEYARTNRGEYLAELYALAVSRPEFLHDVLPQPQIEWLKRVVFRTPVTREEWARQIAVRGDVSPNLFARLLRVFIWEQAGPIIDEILSRQSTAQGS